MSKSDVLQRVQDLCTNQADTTAISKFYDEVLSDLGSRGILTVVELLPVTAGTAQYTPPDTKVRLLDVFYDNRHLHRETLRALEAVNANWRDEVDTPRAYVVEDESNDTFRLYPKPDRDSKDFVFVFGSPFGLDFPEYAVCVLMVENRQPQGNIPTWLELPVAFEVLSREFGRESDHKDAKFAETCKQIGTLLMQMVDP